MRKIAIIVLNIIFIMSIIGCKPKQEKKEILFNARFDGFGGINDIYGEHENNRLKTKFLETNRISGVEYKNELYDPNDSPSKKFIYHPDAPKSITYIINSQEKANEIFNKDMEINYENEMLILYIFGTYGMAFYLDSVALENEKLYININYSSAGDCINYMGQYLIVRLDKININDADFVFTSVEGKQKCSLKSLNHDGRKK